MDVEVMKQKDFHINAKGLDKEEKQYKAVQVITKLLVSHINTGKC